MLNITVRLKIIIVIKINYQLVTIMEIKLLEMEELRVILNLIIAKFLGQTKVKIVSKIAKFNR